MSKKKNDIWIGLDKEGKKLHADTKPKPSENIAEHIYNFSGLTSNRRDFLKSIGFGTAAFALTTACSKSPVKKGMPFFSNSSNAKPGEELWYATTCAICYAHCPLLVKTIDYRPIKIEGNSKANRTKGGMCASGHASLFDLYNSNRIKKPQKGLIEDNWLKIDSEIKEGLKNMAKNNREIAIVMPYSNSPASNQLLKDFKGKYPTTNIYYSDSFAPKNTIEAYKKIFGKAIFPAHNFHKAKIIISFGADFLGSWMSPVEYSNSYLANRDIDNSRTLSYHVQFESQYSITGASADVRNKIKPSEEGQILSFLFQYLKHQKVSSEYSEINTKFKLQTLADKLIENKGKSIVISATDKLNIQILVLGINSILENIGRSIDLDNPLIDESESDFDIQLLKTKIIDKQIGALICWNSELLTDYSSDSILTTSLKSVELKISFNLFRDKFSKHADYLCPDHHYLESWNNYLTKGSIQISQPTINPLVDSRHAQDSFLKWMDYEEDWYTYLNNATVNYIAEKQNGSVQFEEIVRQGFRKISINQPKKYPFNQYKDLFIKIPENETIHSNELEVVFIESQGLKSYTSNLNILLAEYTDPISTSSWHIYAQISAKTAKIKGIKDGQFIRIKTANTEIELPCIIQAGIADSCVIIPAGKMAGALTHTNNPLKLLEQRHTNDPITIEPTTKTKEICRTQTHNYINREAILSEISLKEYLTKKPSQKSETVSSSALSKKRDFHPHHWAMVIDLNKCTGCGSCSISCQTENNIPVIGAAEITKGRSMAWLKVQRFYEGDTNNPSIRFLPMMCQQCDNAPCESVCPVSAVSSSTEGLNQQNYSRCIGVRFCATNCPYLSRTFNYKDYTHQNASSPHMSDKTGRLVLNPEVSVREKGTAEKCTFCVQRIQQAKATAKQNDISLSDGMIQTACQQSCPAQAIYFGDMNDNSSLVYNLSKSKRAHKLLDRLGTQPSVYYLSKVRNTDMDI